MFKIVEIDLTSVIKDAYLGLKSINPTNKVLERAKLEYKQIEWDKQSISFNLKISDEHSKKYSEKELMMFYWDWVKKEAIKAFETVTHITFEVVPNFHNIGCIEYELKNYEKAKIVFLKLMDFYKQDFDLMPEQWIIANEVNYLLNMGVQPMIVSDIAPAKYHTVLKECGVSVFATSEKADNFEVMKDVSKEIEYDREKKILLRRRQNKRYADAVKQTEYIYQKLKAITPDNSLLECIIVDDETFKKKQTFKINTQSQSFKKYSEKKRILDFLLEYVRDLEEAINEQLF